MDSEILFRFNESLNRSEVQVCEPTKRSDFIFFAVLLFILLLFNAIVLLAIIVGRKQLKQYRVFAYVISLLLGNMSLAVVFLYTLITYSYPFERSSKSETELDVLPFREHSYDPNNSADRSIMIWFGFRKTIVMSVFLVMSGNVAALIRGITLNAHFIGRSGLSDARIRIRSSSTSSPNPDTKTKSHNTRNTILILGLTWLIPTVYTIPIFFKSSSCIQYCRCLPGYYTMSFCIAAHDPDKCSNIWLPMTNIHIGFAVIIWFLQLIVIFVMLVFAIKKFWKTTLRSSKKQDIQMVAENQSNNNNSNSGSVSSNVFTFRKASLHPTIKLIIGLSVAYTIATIPIMTCFIVDIFSPGENLNAISQLMFTIFAALVFVYCLVCPALLIVYMPGLRAALLRMLIWCDCTVTVVTSARSLKRKMTNKKSNSVTIN